MGKIPPPYMGPAVATKIILDSSLKNHFQLIHQDTRLNREISEIGSWNWRKPFRQSAILAGLMWKIICFQPQLVWIPISQSTSGFIKDSFYILMSRLLGRRVLVHLRGSNFRNWLSQSPEWVNRYVRFFLRRCVGVIVLGECLRYLFEGFFKPESIFVVPNGADYILPPRLSRDESIVRILYLANLMASKGIGDVIEAVKILKKKGLSEFHLDVVGDWVEANLEAKLMNSVLSNNLPISFHEKTLGKKKFQFFVDADIFVFPPREPEGHPWVIVEAMAAGLPIITTDQGAICESVVDNENGLIVQTKKPKQIANALELLLEDKSLRERLANKGLEKYRLHFTENAMVSRFAGLLQTVCENHEPR